jgi:hemoglobin-like flavoprotein
MALDVELLRDSFELVVRRNPQLTLRFYDVLFEKYPQARSLFQRNSRAKQERMLFEALGAVMDHLDNAPWLTQTLTALGEKHKSYGVTREMYGWVGEALLATLAEAAGADWTPAMLAHWTEAYGTISALMCPPK